MLSALILTAADADVRKKHKNNTNNNNTHRGRVLSTLQPPPLKMRHLFVLCQVCINFSHVNIIFIKVILFYLDAVTRGETLRKR